MWMMPHVACPCARLRVIGAAADVWEAAVERHELGDCGEIRKEGEGTSLINYAAQTDCN